jgi:hypothetical protein
MRLPETASLISHSETSKKEKKRAKDEGLQSNGAPDGFEVQVSSVGSARSIWHTPVSSSAAVASRGNSSKI